MTTVRAGIAVFQPPLERVAQGPTSLVLAMQAAPVQKSMVRLLINGGADVNIPDGEGASPRALAAQRGYTEIVDLIDAAS